MVFNRVFFTQSADKSNSNLAFVLKELYLFFSTYFIYKWFLSTELYNHIFIRIEFQRGIQQLHVNWVDSIVWQCYSSISIKRGHFFLLSFTHLYIILINVMIIITIIGELKIEWMWERNKTVTRKLSALVWHCYSCIHSKRGKFSTFLHTFVHYFDYHIDYHYHYIHKKTSANSRFLPKTTQLNTMYTDLF